MKKTFTAPLEVGPTGSVALLEIPFDVRDVFGKARAPVRGTYNGVPFQTTVGVYGGRYLLGLRKEVRDAVGVSKQGERVKVVIELDDAPRVVEPPAELKRALARSADAKKGWAAFSFTHQREYAQAIADAKKPETRAKRLSDTIAACELKAQRLAAKPSPKKRATAVAASRKPRPAGRSSTRRSSR